MTQETIYWKGQAVFCDLECIGTSIEQRTRRFRVVGVKRFDSHRIMARYLVRVLDFNRMEGVGTVNNEVVFSIANGNSASYFTVAMENRPFPVLPPAKVSCTNRFTATELW